MEYRDINKSASKGNCNDLLNASESLVSRNGIDGSFEKAEHSRSFAIGDVRIMIGHNSALPTKVLS